MVKYLGKHQSFPCVFYLHSACIVIIQNQSIIYRNTLVIVVSVVFQNKVCFFSVITATHETEGHRVQEFSLPLFYLFMMKLY